MTKQPSNLTAETVTVSSIDAELADAGDLRSALEAERATLEAHIAADLRGDTSVFEQRLASVNAKLQALPVMVGNLQTAHDAAERAQLLADYERYTVALYDGYRQVAQIDAEQAEHQAAIEALQKQRAEILASLQLPTGRRLNLQSAGRRFDLSKQFQDIARRYTVPKYL